MILPESHFNIHTYRNENGKRINYHYEGTFRNATVWAVCLALLIQETFYRLKANKSRNSHTTNNPYILVFP